MQPEPKDPLIAEAIEAAIEKHGKGLTARQLDAFRQKMEWTFLNNPAAQRVLERVRAAQPDKSGTKARDDTEAAEAKGKAGGEKAR